MIGDHKITIEPSNMRGERGQHYSVIYKGAILIEDTRNPEYDACRVLLAMGITGKLETWRKDSPYPGLLLDIRKGAARTVEDGRRVGPRFRPWSSHPEMPDQKAVSCSRGQPSTAENSAQAHAPPFCGVAPVAETARAAAS